VNWGKQQRRADGTSWKFAFRQHWKHTLIGVIWGGVLWRMDRTVFWWFVPVLAGMLFAIPFSVWTSRCKTGDAARRAGLFLTPEETEPSADIILLRSTLAESAAASVLEKELCVQQVILDPYYNALHRWLLPEAGDPKFLAALNTLRQNQPELATLREKAISAGLESLNDKEKLLLLSDHAALKSLHRTLWSTPARKMAKSWQSFFACPARKESLSLRQAWPG